MSTANQSLFMFNKYTSNTIFPKKYEKHKLRVKKITRSFALDVLSVPTADEH